MKAAFLAVLLFFCSACPGRAAEGGEGEGSSPLNKVIVLLGDMEQRAIKEGKEAQRAYEEFADFCQDRARDLSHEIKTGKASVESLQATIEQQDATIAKLTARTESLAADISADSSDLKKATEMRKKENEVFVSEEKELVETVDMIKRAIAALEHGASMLQMKNAGTMAQAFTVMVQASLIGTSDADRLSSLIQASQQAESASDDDAFGAPAAAAYEGQSGGIVDTLEDLLDKAETQLDDSRNKENTAQNNYKMTKQSLGDEAKFAEKDMAEAKKGVAAASEKKSNAQGDLTVTKKELAADIETKSELHHDCVSRAQGFESETTSRGAELEVLAKAKQILKESISGAALDQVDSFVQVSSRSKMGSSNLKVVRLVRDLGHKQRSKALVLLSAKIAKVMRNTAHGDPFEKVRSMISDMINKLEDAASNDASKKAYCDKELGVTKAKKEDTTDDLQELGTKIEQMTSKSAKLKENVASLQNELSKLVKTQAEMDKMRAEEKAEFESTKAMVEKSLTGVQTAIKVLKDYFSKDSGDSSGSATVIIGFLEDIESKLSAWLADITSNEESAASEYATMSQENAVDKAAKDTDVKFKTKEAKQLDKSTAETSTDETSEQDQLDAVSTYLSKIQDECIAKPESYEERKKRREAEIEGLKQALDILDSQTALLQRHTSHRTLRGARRHAKIAA